MGKMGRPTTPDYRKKSLRYSKVEDTFNKCLEKVESEKTKALILEALKEIRGA